jgi:hypothetical protein
MYLESLSIEHFAELRDHIISTLNDRVKHLQR